MLAPVPRWLVHGFAQSFLGRTELMLAVARRSVDAGHPQSAGDLLEWTRLPSDPLELELFQANAWLFTASLLGLPGGGMQAQRFLVELGAQQSASNAFWSVYGGNFASATALEKWWSVQRMHRVEVTVAQALSANETRRQLDEIVRAKLNVPAGLTRQQKETEATLATLTAFYDKRWLKEILRVKIQRLEALRAQAHPCYRPVIDQYSGALAELAAERLNRFKRALKIAETAHNSADWQVEEIAAFLDRAERLYGADDTSATFQKYFRIFEQHESLEQQRHSPISDYLDQFDK